MEERDEPVAPGILCNGVPLDSVRCKRWIARGVLLGNQVLDEPGVRLDEWHTA